MTVEVSVWLTVGCPELSPGACCSSSWWRSRLLPGRDLLSRTDDQTWSCDRYSQHHSHPYRGSDGGKETEGGKDRNQKRWWVLIWFSRTSRGFWFWFVTFFEWRFFKDQAQKTQKKQHSLCPWIAFFQFSLLKWGGTYPKRRCHTHQLAFSFRALVPWRSDRGVRGFFLVIPGWQEERTRREIYLNLHVWSQDEDPTSPLLHLYQDTTTTLFWPRKYSFHPYFISQPFLYLFLIWLPFSFYLLHPTKASSRSCLRMTLSFRQGK